MVASNKILTLGICCILLIVTIAGCGVTNSKTEKLESTYLESSDEKDLVILCNNLLNTKQYEKKMQYFSKIIDMEKEEFEVVYESVDVKQQPRDIYGTEMGALDAYCEIFAQYLLAPVMMEDYDLYKKIFPDTWRFTEKEIGGATSFYEYMRDSKLPEEGYQVIISTFQENFPKDITNAPNDVALWRKVTLNYEGQAFAYLCSGDEENYNKVLEESYQFDERCGVKTPK